MANFGSTNTKPRTLQNVLDNGNPNDMDAAMAQLDIGTKFTPLKRTFTGLTSNAVQDLTAIDGTGETAGAGNPNRLPIDIVRTLRVTAGTLAAGPAIVTDAGGTATAIGTGSAHVVLLSDDGKTLTFQAAVTGFVIEYMPRTVSLAAMTSDFAT